MRLLALSLLAPVVLRADDEDDDEQATAASQKKMAARRKALWESKRYDETGFERMKPPQEGEWLHRFVESNQDEDDYKKECANKRRKGRETIYLRSLGPLSARAKAAIPARNPGRVTRRPSVFGSWQSMHATGCVTCFVASA